MIEITGNILYRKSPFFQLSLSRCNTHITLDSEVSCAGFTRKGSYNRTMRDLSIAFYTRVELELYYNFDSQVYAIYSYT
jgi:hypothetical protein